MSYFDKQFEFIPSVNKAIKFPKQSEWNLIEKNNDKK